VAVKTGPLLLNGQSKNIMDALRICPLFLVLSELLPIQNIGTYGVEVKDVFVELEAVELATGEKRIFSKEECLFGYRSSIFKNDLKGRYFIAWVAIKLTKSKHELSVNYGSIGEILAKKGIGSPSIRDVSDAVISARSNKLPDISTIGSAGSFFKKPEISKEHFGKLSARFPEMSHYELLNGNIKIPAAWLIEHEGWKGKRVGDAGVYSKHALVLVNYGKASGTNIRNLASAIIDSVKSRFEIELIPEVNII